MPDRAEAIDRRQRFSPNEHHRRDRREGDPRPGSVGFGGCRTGPCWPAANHQAFGHPPQRLSQRLPTRTTAGRVVFPAARWGKKGQLDREKREAYRVLPSGPSVALLRRKRRLVRGASGAGHLLLRQALVADRIVHCFPPRVGRTGLDCPPPPRRMLPVGEAFLWGLVRRLLAGLGRSDRASGSDHSPPVGLIMAFGAGVLDQRRRLRARPRAFKTSAGEGGIAIGLLSGRLSSLELEVMIDRLGRAKQTTPAGGGTAIAGRAIVLGIILDGIPESLILGLTVLEAGTVSVAFLFAVFIANLPEAIAATAALERAGRDRRRLMRFWVLVALGFGLASLLGYVALDTASPRTLAFVLAFAGGAVLTMLANTMMPEALHHGGKLAGFVTTLGFAVAFAISSLQ